MKLNSLQPQQLETFKATAFMLNAFKLMRPPKGQR